METKTLAPVCWLLHLLLLLGCAVTSNGDTTAISPEANTTSTGITTSILSASSTTVSPGTGTSSSGSSTAGSASTSGGATIAGSASTSGGATTADSASASGGATTAGSASTSGGANTAATSSAVTSTSTATSGNEESLSGHLRPWEVALITLATVAIAAILFTGLLFSLSSCLDLRNLNTDLYHPHGLSFGSSPTGYYGVRSRACATEAGSRSVGPPTAMELSGRHGDPACP